MKSRVVVYPRRLAPIYKFNIPFKKFRRRFIFGYHHASTLGKAWARRVIAPAAMVRPSLQNLQRQGQQHLHVFVCLLPIIFELRTRGSEDLQVSY